MKVEKKTDLEDKSQPKLPHEKPEAIFVPLKPEERLMQCGKVPQDKTCKRSKRHS